MSALPRSPLQAILDDDAARAAGWTIPALARACLAGGATCLQVRAKRLPSGAFLDVCDAVVAAARPFGAIVIVNDRADLACLSGAAGVHVGQDDLPVSAVRALVGDSAVVGLSTHTAEQVADGLAQRVDYIAVGPIFGTATKDTGYAAAGPGLVKQARALAREGAGTGGVRPVVAIGGMTLERARAAVDAGASAVAVISDLLITGDPEARVREYLSALTGSTDD